MLLLNRSRLCKKNKFSICVEVYKVFKSSHGLIKYLYQLDLRETI